MNQTAMTRPTNNAPARQQQGETFEEALQANADKIRQAIVAFKTAA